MAWTVPYTWSPNDSFDEIDANTYIRDNLNFLFNEAAAAAIQDISESAVTTDNHDVGWRTIRTIYMHTYGKAIYAHLEFDITAGLDVWDPGTVVVGVGDTSAKVERVGDQITQVQIRKAPDDPDAYNLANKEYLQLIDQVSEMWTLWQRALNRGWPGDDELAASREAQLHALRAQRDAAKSRRDRARGSRYRTIFSAGDDQTIIESTQTTTTHVSQTTFTERYEEATVRLLVDSELQRQLIDRRAGGIVRTGTFYIVNIPAGNHRIDVQWNSPQFDGMTPTNSATLISLQNFNLRIKEVRYPLLDFMGTA